MPKEIDTSMPLRVKGKGLYDYRLNSYGDYIIKLKIEIPQNLTDTQCQKIVSVLNEEKTN